MLFGKKVSDLGGGIPLQSMEKIFDYLYTTADPVEMTGSVDSTGQLAHLAGFGCGLPLSRLCATYLGGDLEVITVPGYGTDAYLYLSRIDSRESVPHAFEMHLQGSSLESGSGSSLERPK